MQLVSEAVGRLLPPRDWLPILQDQLDLTALIVQAAIRVQPGGAGTGEGGVAALQQVRQAPRLHSPPSAPASSSRPLSSL